MIPQDRSIILSTYLIIISNEPESVEEQTLKAAVFEGGYGADMWLEVLAAFEASHPGVTAWSGADKELAVFGQTGKIAVINNSMEPRDTDLYVMGRLYAHLEMAPMEMQWITYECPAQ